MPLLTCLCSSSFLPTQCVEVRANARLFACLCTEDIAKMARECVSLFEMGTGKRGYWLAHAPLATYLQREKKKWTTTTTNNKMMKEEKRAHKKVRGGKKKWIERKQNIFLFFLFFLGFTYL